MQFRKDINGLRAIAVLGVVFYHFIPNFVPGGFAGVDVFFVISGYLMTKIIFTGLQNNTFSLAKFYGARVKRIVPSLVILCLVILISCFFLLSSEDYQVLGKHVLATALFLSNIVYWSESGYFDVASAEKWLLHTWSLSVEWQFYILFPLLGIFLFKLFSQRNLFKIVLFGCFVSFLLSVVCSLHWPTASYFMLPTRSWEMLLGGVAYLYPIQLSIINRDIIEKLGILLVLCSFCFLSQENTWPGYLAAIPVLGTFLVIQANRDNSFITNNSVFQFIGKTSYSTYLWHWPLVVLLGYFSLESIWICLFIPLSFLIGWINYIIIETAFQKNFKFSFKSIVIWVWIVLYIFVVFAGWFVYKEDGLIRFKSNEYREIASQVTRSPLREDCQVSEYLSPGLSCEYYTDDIQWAVLGDSHSTELAFALATKLQEHDLGLKQFSFSGCAPSYGAADDFHKCSEWYNDAVNYLLEQDGIQNIVINHSLVDHFFGEVKKIYPDTGDLKSTIYSQEVLKNLDRVIVELAKVKKHVFVVLPTPSIPNRVLTLVDVALKGGQNLRNIKGTSLDYFKERSGYIFEHYQNADYPENVHFVDVEDIFCDESECFAVRDGVPLFFDDDHPSVRGAQKIVERLFEVDILDN